MPPDGVVIVNKPGGITSRQVASRVARATRAAKAGHAGTLDPLATGVLVVCLGRATLLTSYLAAGNKEYLVEALLGVRTDTCDIDGKAVERAGAPGVTEGDVKAACRGLTGTIRQVPPDYSAVKHEGKRLYEYARKGRDVPAIERTVTVESIDIVSLVREPDGPLATLRIVCGPGTYVRSLVRDMGFAVGCGACVASLERRRSGHYRIEDSLGLPQIEDLGERVPLIGMEEATSRMPTLVLEGEEATAVTMGKPLLDCSPEVPESEGVFRILDGGGKLLAFYGPPRDDDGEEITARAVRVIASAPAGRRR